MSDKILIDDSDNEVKRFCYFITFVFGLFWLFYFAFQGVKFIGGLI